MSNTKQDSGQPIARARGGQLVNVERLKQLPGATVKQIALITLTVLTLFPLYFMFISALKSRDEFINNLLGLPQTIYFQNFVNVIQHPYLFTWFKNSIFLTGVSVLIATAVSIPAAYAFAQMDFKGRNFLFGVITPLMVIPPIVMIIPMFILFGHLDMINSLWGPVVIYGGLMVPFTIYLLRNFFITIPTEIQEAALIDGCTTFQVLTFIYLPLARPALITSMLVNGVWVWNELLIALVFLQSEELRTLIVGIAVSLQKRFTLDVPALMAGLAIATIPMIVLYAVGQRALVRGLVAGFDK